MMDTTHGNTQAFVPATSHSPMSQPWQTALIIWGTLFVECFFKKKALWKEEKTYLNGKGTCPFRIKGVAGARKEASCLPIQCSFHCSISLGGILFGGHFI